MTLNNLTSRFDSSFPYFVFSSMIGKFTAVRHERPFRFLFFEDENFLFLGVVRKKLPASLRIWHGADSAGFGLWLLLFGMCQIPSLP